MVEAMIYLVVIPLVGFCFLAWWVHQSSQWRIGRSATDFDGIRFFVLNALSLMIFLFGALSSFFMLFPLDQRSDYAPESDPAWLVSAITLQCICVAMPLIVIGSFWLALSRHASLVHSFIGMTLSYAWMVVIILARLWEAGFRVYMANGIVFNQGVLLALFIENELIFWGAYFLLFTTGGYLISERLKYEQEKRD